MKRCYFSKRYAIYARINSICGFLMGSILLLSGIFLTEAGCVLRCVLLILGVSITTYLGFFVIVLTRRYEVNKKGITIQYANRYSVLYPWESIQFVCVCITHRSSTGTTQDEVILFTTKKTDRPFSTESRIFTSWEYDFFHCKSIVTIEYTEERIDEFISYYGKLVPDYR